MNSRFLSRFAYLLCCLLMPALLSADITLDDFESGDHSMTTAPFDQGGQYDTHDAMPGAVGPMRLIDHGLAGSSTAGFLTTEVTGGDLVIDYDAPAGTGIVVVHGIYGGRIGIPESGPGDVDTANLDTIPVPLDLTNEVAFQLEYTYTGVSAFSIVELYAFGTTTTQADYDRAAQFNLEVGTHTVLIPLDTFFNNVDRGLVGAVGIGYVGLGTGTVQIHDFSVVGGSNGTVTVSPNSLDVTEGDLVSGGLTELNTSDNIDLAGTRSTSDVLSRVFLELKSVSPTQTPTRFEFTLEASVFARTTVNQTIDMWDYDLGDWETVDMQPAARFTDSVVVASPTGDLSRFVEAGTGCMQTRCRFQSVRARQRFNANIDHTFWTIE